MLPRGNFPYIFSSSIIVPTLHHHTEREPKRSDEALCILATGAYLFYCLLGNFLGFDIDAGDTLFLSSIYSYERVALPRRCNATHNFSSVKHIHIQSHCHHTGSRPTIVPKKERHGLGSLEPWTRVLVHTPLDSQLGIAKQII